MGKDPGEKPAEVPSRSPRSWTAEEKFRAVMEAATIPEADLGEFLRKKGLHAVQLEEWRGRVILALTKDKKTPTTQGSKDAKRIRELEKDLHRKDRALAEVTALLALKKKLEMLWGGEGDDTPTRSAK